MRTHRLALVLPFLALALAPLGCVHPHRHHGRSPAVHKPGPPPWAPAHGHRHKHKSGVDLRFDSHLGVYAVVGLPDHFFHHGHFYRRTHHGWLVGSDVHGPWKAAASAALPPGLRAKGSAAKGGPPGRGAKRGGGPPWAR